MRVVALGLPGLAEALRCAVGLVDLFVVGRGVGLRRPGPGTGKGQGVVLRIISAPRPCPRRTLYALNRIPQGTALYDVLIYEIGKWLVGQRPSPAARVSALSDGAAAREQDAGVFLLVVRHTYTIATKTGSYTTVYWTHVHVACAVCARTSSLGPLTPSRLNGYTTNSLGGGLGSAH